MKWHVDNKYYSANIELFVCANPDHDAWESEGGFLGRERGYQAVIFLCQLDKVRTHYELSFLSFTCKVQWVWYGSALCLQAESVDALKLLWTRIKSQQTPGGEFPIPDVRVVVGVASSASSDSELLQWSVGEGIELIRWEREEDGSKPTQECGR